MQLTLCCFRDCFFEIVKKSFVKSLLILTKFDSNKVKKEGEREGKWDDRFTSANLSHLSPATRERISTVVSLCELYEIFPKI